MNLTKYIFIIIVYLSIINCQCEDYEYGDANYDNNLDIVDIVIIVDIIYCFVAQKTICKVHLFPPCEPKTCLTGVYHYFEKAIQY